MKRPMMTARATWQSALPDEFFERHWDRSGVRYRPTRSPYPSLDYREAYWAATSWPAERAWYHSHQAQIERFYVLYYAPPEKGTP